MASYFGIFTNKIRRNYVSHATHKTELKLRGRNSPAANQKNQLFIVTAINDSPITITKGLLAKRYRKKCDN